MEQAPPPLQISVILVPYHNIGLIRELFLSIKKVTIHFLIIIDQLRILSCLGKQFTSYLLIKLRSWLSDKQVLRPSHIGFKGQVSTIDHWAVPAHLVEKYTKWSGDILYLAFIYLKRAFDCIPHTRLWEKLPMTSADHWLLWLIHKLYQNNTAQVRCGNHSQLTKEIKINRQGCFLASYFFNLCINDIDCYLSGEPFHPPHMFQSLICNLLCQQCHIISHILGFCSLLFSGVFRHK